MTSHRQTLELPYRPEDLFDLASDVGRYPEFVTWIQSLKIVSEQEEPGRVRSRAEVTVGFKGFRETFVTDVDARETDLAIDVTLVRGPFRKLANGWKFSPADQTPDSELPTATAERPQTARDLNTQGADPGAPPGTPN